MPNQRGADTACERDESPASAELLNVVASYSSCTPAGVEFGKIFVVGFVLRGPGAMRTESSSSGIHPSFLSRPYAVTPAVIAPTPTTATPQTMLATHAAAPDAAAAVPGAP